MKTLKDYLWLWRAFTLAGLFGLALLISIWNIWLAKTQVIPVALELAMYLPPLFWLAWGILRGNSVRHVHGILISLFYATLGVWFIFTPKEGVYGFSLLFLSILLYFGAFLGLKSTQRPTKRPQ
ncbi:MAG: hypothetical protein CR991_06630 [Proteobacteria bacterium]|nr:MAG: hypothetical protein CR991_06630 [Pseudomonadota bacterium]